MSFDNVPEDDTIFVHEKIRHPLLHPQAISITMFECLYHKM